MAKKPEIRLSQNTALVIAAVAILAVFGFSQGWFDASDAEPVETVTPEGVPFSVVPAIEKTKIYVSAFDQADFDGETQKNRVAGSADLIKSGNVLETVNTSTSTGVSSTAEFNGADMVTVLADATNYYAHAEAASITETLQPFEVQIKAAATPDTAILDDKRDELSAPYTITLATNDVSKTHYINVERPGDDAWYQLCGVAADYDDEMIDVRVNVDGSFVEGNNDLDDAYDALDTAGADFVWDYDMPIMDFDEVEIPFVVGTAKDVNPSAMNLTVTVFDCEENLQNGEIVYTNEDSADADLGLSNIEQVIAIA